VPLVADLVKDKVPAHLYLQAQVVLEVEVLRMELALRVSGQEVAEQLAKDLLAEVELIPVV
jgi:hypothetical protein